MKKHLMLVPRPKPKTAHAKLFVFDTRMRDLIDALREREGLKSSQAVVELALERLWRSRRKR